ncbi:MAG: MlaD family protein [Solirubrobacteraceae bacterium]
MAILATIVIGGAVALAVRTRTSSGGYRVAAIFDTARGIVAGQQVKIAGAVVGTVDEIDLAPGPKARIVMSVERRFAPFHEDATCTILSEGLISENYVECDPGSRGAPLATGAGGVPAVPLAQTSIPFSLQDVLNVFSMPTDDRLRVLISELGIGASGRGEDLNALLQRANPALGASQRVLSILDAQRQQIATAVGQTDQVVGRLAAESGQVRTFVDQTAAVARTTAQHSAALSWAVHNLPAMLDAVRPGLRSLDLAARNASPLLDSLHTSSPGIASLTATLPSLARAGIPAFRSLASAAARGRPALRDATPVISQLGTASAQLAPLADQLDQLFVSLRSTGGIEGTLRLLYTIAVVASSYDSVSHLIGFMANVAPQCLAGESAGSSVAGCSKAYTAPGQGTVPINEPSCGPQRPQDLWRDHYCPLPAPIPIALSRGTHTHSGRTHPATRPVAPTSSGKPSTSPAPGRGSGAAPAGGVLAATLQGLAGKLLGGGTSPPTQLQGVLNYLLKR